MKQKKLSIRIILGSIFFLVWNLTGISQNIVSLDKKNNPESPGSTVVKAPGRVSVLDFTDKVIDRGKPTEDWQPAIGAAIEQAYSLGGRPVYFPAATYLIRKAVNVPPPQNHGWCSALLLVGDGPRHSIIKQMTEEENVINWSGPTYKKSAAHGSISGLCLQGGKIGLNIKWHNQFRLSNCYIVAASDTGIYAEGYSSSFKDIIIRWCNPSSYEWAWSSVWRYCPEPDRAV